MPNLKERLGILRSVAAYYWKPFNKKKLMNFYSQFVKPNSLCFDLGAHLGNRTNAWYALGAKIIAIEPQSSCMNYMKKRFKGKDNIILLECAVGEKAGTAKMHLSAMTPTISTLSDEGWRKTINEDTSFEVKWEKVMEVRVTTLDNLIAEYGIPDFCKIDVENFELPVLLGLSQPIPALSVEFYPATIQDAIKCIERLEQIGRYGYNWSTAESQKFNSKTWISATELINIFQKYRRADRYGDFYARRLD